MGEILRKNLKRLEKAKKLLEEVQNTIPEHYVSHPFPQELIVTVMYLNSAIDRVEDYDEELEWSGKHE
ncbi:MAG: hypothetical protein ACLFUR_06660 [Candidatus Hadarchaeia archaeon]